VSYAVAEGGATGTVGFVGLLPDIPALFGISHRVIQQIGTRYGYDVALDHEREYAMQVLSLGASGDLKPRSSSSAGLKEVEILLKITWEAMNEALARKQLSRHSLLASVRQRRVQARVPAHQKKGPPGDPHHRGAGGRLFQRVFVNDVARAAYMSYRRRRIAEIEGADAQ